MGKRSTNVPRSADDEALVILLDPPGTGCKYSLKVSHSTASSLLLIFCTIQDGRVHLDNKTAEEKKGQPSSTLEVQREETKREKKRKKRRSDVCFHRESEALVCIFLLLVHRSTLFSLSTITSHMRCSDICSNTRG